ncbi:MAG TPA: DUF485 domain-containing protein [Chloroflexota bacterium]|nr:DUF485 domain-containing protein [Chloroflexota bacterium]
MKSPFGSERRRQPARAGAQAAGAGVGALAPHDAVLGLEPLDVGGGLEPLDDWLAAEPLDEAAVLDALEALLPADEALQEIAEQTAYGEVLMQDLVRRQLRLGLSVAAVFLVILLGLPLMNLLFPALVQMRLLGLPMAWLALAVLVYPFVWALALYFVSTARKYEDEFTALVK